jgi:RHS repeat-associated protein
VAAVGRTGTLAFRVAYDAFGEARHLPAKDINGDGKVDRTDTTLAQNASGKKLGQPGYNPDADWDRDGKITSADVAQFGSRSYVAALPQGQLAQPGSATPPAAGDVSPGANLARAANARSDFNIGFSGYRFNGDIGAYTVRFRHYDPTPGMCRWLERDPAGYQDGPSLYSYLGRNPMAGTDPYGLASDDGEWHHVIPQELEDEVKRYFGDDFLHSTENGLILPRDVHRELHGDGYNENVKKILDKMKRMGKLQHVNPKGKNAKQIQAANRKQLGGVLKEIKKLHGVQLAKGVKALVGYKKWKNAGLAKGFFKRLTSLGRRTVSGVGHVPAALVFMFIASALTDSMAHSMIQTTREYANLMKYYEAGNIDRITGAVDEVVLRIRLMGNQYNDYADQFEEIWKEEIIPGMCANP